MRKYYVDNIRWFTVVLVVIYHVIYMYNGIITEGVIGSFYAVQYQDAVQYFLYPWFMVILFIVSGVSSRYYLENHTVKEFVKSRTRKLLVPSTIGLFVFQWIQGYFNMQLSKVFDTVLDTISAPMLFLIMVLSGTGVLWYIQMLWLYSMVLAFLHRFEKGKLYRKCEKITLPALAVAGILLWVFAQIGNTPVIAVYRFGIYAFSFLLGYFVFAQESVVKKLSKYWIFLALTAVILGTAYTCYYFGENYAVEPVVNSPFSIAYGWTAVLAVFACMKRWGDKTTGFIKWMGKKSFGLYVFHYLPLAATAYWMDAHMQLPSILSYMIAAIAAFGGGYLLDEVISSIPILRWCVLGIKKEK